MGECARGCGDGEGEGLDPGGDDGTAASECCRGADTGQKQKNAANPAGEFAVSIQSAPEGEHEAKQSECSQRSGSAKRFFRGGDNFGDLNGEGEVGRAAARRQGGRREGDGGAGWNAGDGEADGGGDGRTVD